MANIAILGSGGWGTALAVMANRHGHAVTLWSPFEEEIASIAAFAKGLDNVKEMHLLPYHRIGSDKYAGLGRPYTMAHISPPPKEQMERLLAIVNATGLIGKIGG